MWSITHTSFWFFGEEAHQNAALAHGLIAFSAEGLSMA
jgi:hypothetical protein